MLHAYCVLISVQNYWILFNYLQLDICHIKGSHLENFYISLQDMKNCYIVASV